MSSIISNRSIIKVSGVDSTKFLQNLITNNITSETSMYAMMLSAQGRFLFDMFIVKIAGDTYLLEVFTGTKDIMLKKLGMYKINLDVVIEDMADLRVYYSNVRMRDVAIYKDPRYSKLGYRIISDSDPHAQSSYMSDKYKYAIPDGGVDLLYDKAMPQEYGAEELHAISYTKGCYVGQEVISRTKSQGVVRKKIYKISADINLSEINHGAILVAGDQKIGIFCSGYKNYGIALIREENLKEKFGIAIALNGIEVHIECAEWYHAAS